MLGLAFCDSLAAWLGLPARLLLGISLVTGVYALGALRLATLATVPLSGLRLLVGANWAWTLVSVGLVAVYFDRATVLGQAYLVLQVVVCGGLAWLEGRFTAASGS